VKNALQKKESEPKTEISPNFSLTPKEQVLEEIELPKGTIFVDGRVYTPPNWKTRERKHTGSIKQLEQEKRLKFHRPADGETPPAYAVGWFIWMRYRRL